MAPTGRCLWQRARCIWLRSASFMFWFRESGNPKMLKLEKYSIGTGDRFGCQAAAQLRACMLALEEAIDVVPVWNKSNREHNLIGSEPSSVRAAAERAVCELGWDRPWHVDADHINIDTVGRFLGPSDFFTIDVA